MPTPAKKAAASPPAPTRATQRPGTTTTRPGAISDAVAFDFQAGGTEEHRQFPRAKLKVRFEAWIGEGAQRRFQASFHSVNISVSGAFLESTFFLPLGTEIRVSFTLDEEEEAVQARASIVREERPDPRTGDGRSGFGLKFVEFYSQTEVTLAKLFLAKKLRDFSTSYLASRRARALTSELDRVIDALAAWELQKVTLPGDPWTPLEQE